MITGTAARALWCLNLDAEDELRHGLGYTPSRATLEAVAAARDGARGLLAPGDLLMDDANSTERATTDLRGRAWCPTPRAIARLVAAGATVAEAPSLAVLQRANASRFPYDVLGARLSGARVATTLADAEAWLSARPASEAVWIKRAFGAAGRGKLRANGGPLAAHVRAFLSPAELALGVVLEPHAAITLECSLHALLAPDGSFTAGVPCIQRVERGRFVAVRVAQAGELHPAEIEGLADALARLAHALHREGYFGPLGVDAYRYTDESGAVQWNPCGELNARHTMGYALGMASHAPNR